MPQNIRMPNGTVIQNVPEGVGPDQVKQQYIAAYGEEAWEKLLVPAGATEVEPVQPRRPEPGTGRPPAETIVGEMPAPPVDPREQVLDSARIATPEAPPEEVVPADRPFFSSPASRETPLKFESRPTTREEDVPLWARLNRDPVEAAGRRARQLVESGEATPRDLGITEEDYDRVTQDRLQRAMQERQNVPAPDGTPAEQAPEDDSGRGWWKLAKEVWKQLPGQIAAGQRMQWAAAGREGYADASIGRLFLEELSEQSGEMSEDAQKLVSGAAERHGMSEDEYATYIAAQLDEATRREFKAAEDYQKAAEVVQAAKPKSATEGGWLPHIASLAIENTPQLSYIIAGVATANPAVTVGLFGTDVYSREFAQARMDGRSVGEATQDAFAAAAIEAATEAVPVGRIAKLMRAGNKSAAKKLLEGIATEGAQEILAEASQIAYDVGIVGDEMTMGEAFARMRDAGVIGGMMGGVVASPAAAFGDNKMADADKALGDAKAKLRSVVLRVQNPNERISGAEVREAKEAYQNALKAKRKIVEERLEAKKKKKEAKTRKKEEKAYRKATPAQRQRMDKQREQAKADQTVKGAVTKDDIRIVETLEKVGTGEIGEQDTGNLKEALDLGYAKVTKSGNVMVLPAGRRRVKAVRDVIGKAAPEPAVVVRPRPELKKPKPKAVEKPDQVGEFRAEDSPEFKKWFSGSKVTDENMEPLTVYHGTSRKGLTQFDEKFAGDQTGAINSSLGFFFTNDAVQADSYKGPSGEMVEAYLALKNPVKIKGRQFDQDASAPVNEAVAEFSEKPISELSESDFKEWRETLEARGHDGIVVEIPEEGQDDPLVNYIAFRPNQIQIKPAGAGEHRKRDSKPRQAPKADKPADRVTETIRGIQEIERPSVPRAFAAGEAPPAPAEGMVRFRHFGNKADVDVLDPSAAGTGLRDQRFRRGSSAKSVSLYPEQMVPGTPEAGVGPHEFVVDVPEERLYDASEDALGLIDQARVATAVNIDGKPTGPRQFDLDRFESLVRRSGFAGYHTPKAEGILAGQARIFEPIPVERGTANAEFRLKRDQEPEGYRRIRRYLTTQESEKLQRRSASRLVELFNSLPPDADFEAAALAGIAKRGWYRRTTETISQIFGADAERFAALLAATSPRTPVNENLDVATRMWTEWVKAGRPTDQAGIWSVTKPIRDFDAWNNNIVIALASENPMVEMLSGPKVDSFMRNLMGDMQEVTNDGWMATFAFIRQTLFKGDKTKTDPGKGTGYLAYSAKIRRVARNLSKKTGTEWTPAEVQETIWSWTKTAFEMAEAAGEKRSIEQLIREGAITDEAVAKAEDFATLFSQNASIRETLEAAGYGQAIQALEQEFGGRSTGAGAEAATQPSTRALIRNARRLDRVRDARRREDEGEVAPDALPAQFLVLSAERSELAPEENRKRTQKMRRQLKDLGYDPIAAEGMYQGASEASFVVPVLDNKQRAEVYDLAFKEYGQESVLRVDDSREARLEFAEDFPMNLGQFTEVADTSGLEAFTRIGNKSFAAMPAEAAAEFRTEDPEFKRWFGDSKVVDYNGDPLVVYHGTAEDFTDFDFDGVTADAVFFAEDPAVADVFAKTSSGKTQRTISAHLSIKNPLEQDFSDLVDADGNFSQDELVAAIDYAKSNGYDGLKIENVIENDSLSPSTQWAVFDRGQIRVADNAEARATDKAADRPVSKESIEELLDKHFKPYYGIANFKVSESYEEFPFTDRIVAERIGNVMGMHTWDPLNPERPPTIFIHAPAHNNIDEVIETALHELMHFGLQSFLGTKNYESMMEAVLRAFPAEIAKARGITEGQLMEMRGSQRHLQAEEFLAYLAQKSLDGRALSKNEQSLWDRLVTMVNLALARMGLKRMSKNDIARLIMASNQYVRRNGQAELNKRVVQVQKMKAARRAMERAGVMDKEFSLKSDRDADPDLDRFLAKIGHSRGSKLQSFRDWWTTKQGRIKEIFEIEVLDQFAGIKHLERELGILDAAESSYISVRLTAGTDTIIRAALENGVPIWDDEGVPATKPGTRGLIEILAPIGQSKEMLKMFEAYVVAKRAARLSKEGRERLLKREEIAAVKRYVQKHNLQELFEQTAAEMQEWKKGVLDFAQAGGLIDPQTRPLWERNDHVPFYRVLSDKSEHGPFAHSRMGQLGQVIHRLKGGTDVLKNPLESIVQNAGALIEAAVKNRAMADVVRNFEGTGAVTKAPQAEITAALIPMKQIKDMLEEQGVSLDAVGEEMLQGVRKLMALQPPNGDNVFSVQVNGKKQYYYAHDPGLMRAMGNINPNQWIWLMKALRFPKRVLTRAITLTPDFILKNWFRDMMHSYVMARDGQPVPIYDSLKGWGKAIAHDETFKDIMAGGGMFDSGYVNASDPRKQNIAIRKGILKKGRHNILDTPKKLADFYMRIANGAENAHRVVVYQKTLAKTGSRKKAIFEARDLMDFSVRGANPIVRFLTETVPFWGARVQGISRTAKGFTETPGRTALRAIPIVFASVALYAINRDDERYKALSGYEKRMYYHFFDVFEQGDIWRLPKPFEVGALFSSVPEVLSEYIFSQEPDRGKQMADSIAWIVKEMMMLSPDVQLGHPLYELDKNWNSFTESPIVSYWEQQLPPEDRWSHTTSPTAKWLAQKMPDAAPEWFRSPDQLEYLLQGYFGSMMDYGLTASDMLYHKANPHEPQPPVRRLDETPFVKAFRREETRKYDKYIEELYQVLSEAEKIHNGINRNIKLGTEEGRDRARMLREENESLLYARAAMKPAGKALGKLNDAIQRIYQHKSMTPKEKRERIDELLRRRSEIAREAYPYRPGGPKNKFEGGEPVESRADQVIELIDRLRGKPKKEQVDELIGANLPHTAILVNDVNINNEKLRKAAA